MLKWSRKGLVLVFLILVVLAAGRGDFRPSNLDLTVAPYKYDLVRWEVSHFLDKWVHKLADLMPWTNEPSREERISQAIEFFDLGQRMRELEQQLLLSGSDSEDSDLNDQSQTLNAQIKGLKLRRDRMRASVEEIIESEISAVLSQEGFASRIGLIFPPVDTVFSRSPGVLILSPRDRIFRLETVLMEPGLSDSVREQIEERFFQSDNLSALVENTGGVAAFPSVVSESGSLRHAVETVAHEWLHHWFFFQPLGQHFWDNSQMTTLNETAATLGGRAIGDRVFTAITGELVVREPERPPASQDPGAFDFNSAMNQTRLRTDELLSEGKILEAEAYMEERRQLMVANGHFIRKINQAFFAFHGTYATSAASISPIDEQLKELRSRSDSLEDFLKTVATFDSYQEFLEYLEGGFGQAPSYPIHIEIHIVS